MKIAKKPNILERIIVSIILNIQKILKIFKMLKIIKILKILKILKIAILNCWKYESTVKIKKEIWKLRNYNKEERKFVRRRASEANGYKYKKKLQERMANAKKNKSRIKSATSSAGRTKNSQVAVPWIA